MAVNTHRAAPQREGQRVEASEVDTTFPLFSQWCQVGRGGSAGGRIDAINANY